MSKLANKLKELKQNLIVLNQTRRLTKEDLALPEFYELNEDYKATADGSSSDKTIVSIKNSIITQRRIVFCLTRDSIRKMVSEDKNHKDSVGFRNEHYASVIKVGIDVGLFKEVQKGYKRVASVYEVADSGLLNYLVGNRDLQLKEAIDFVSKNTLGDHKRDHKRDLVGSREYKEDSTKSSSGLLLLDPASDIALGKSSLLGQEDELIQNSPKEKVPLKRKGTDVSTVVSTDTRPDIPRGKFTSVIKSSLKTEIKIQELKKFRFPISVQSDVINYLKLEADGYQILKALNIPLSEMQEAYFLKKLSKGV